MRRTATLLSLLLLVSVIPVVAQTPVDEKALDTNEGTPMAAPADVEMYSGTNVGGPEWERPYILSPCTISGIGFVRYSEQPFFIATDGICDITSIQSYDGYLHVYEGSWDPLDQCTNLIALDDDGAGGIGTSDILGLGIAGGTYWIVTSGYSDEDNGTFDNTISCDVDVTLGLPTPTMGGTWMVVMILVLLAGGLLITRFRIA